MVTFSWSILKAAIAPGRAYNNERRNLARFEVLACALHVVGFGMLTTNSKRRTEMKVFRVTVAGALVLFAVTAGFAMSVNSDYEKNFDFSHIPYLSQ